jgi:hypothetical protein
MTKSKRKGSQAAWKCLNRIPLGLRWSADQSEHKIPVFWMQWQITEYCKVLNEYRIRVELGAPVYPMTDSRELELAFRVFCQVAPILERAAEESIR